jgi:hypothetical protein
LVILKSLAEPSPAGQIKMKIIKTPLKFPGASAGPRSNLSQIIAKRQRVYSCHPAIVLAIMPAKQVTGAIVSPEPFYFTAYEVPVRITTGRRPWRRSTTNCPLNILL